MEQAIGREPLAHGVGEAGKLDAVHPHDADPAKLEALGEIEDRPAFHQRREGFLRRDLRRDLAGRCGCRQGSSGLSLTRPCTFIRRNPHR